MFKTKKKKRERVLWVDCGSLKKDVSKSQPRGPQDMILQYLEAGSGRDALSEHEVMYSRAARSHMTGVLNRNGHRKAEMQREGHVKTKIGVTYLQAKGPHELPEATRG